MVPLAGEEALITAKVPIEGPEPPTALQVNTPFAAAAVIACPPVQVWGVIVVPALAGISTPPPGLACPNKLIVRMTERKVLINQRNIELVPRDFSQTVNFPKTAGVEIH